MNYPAMLTISPIRNNSDEITHFVGIHEDLSEHKTLEAQFRQAQKMEALGTLVGGIAHDFNNMLAGMVGNLFMVKKRMQGMPELTEKIERVEKVSFQAADMIKQMLVFARSEEVEMKQVSITSFINEVFQLHQIVIPENIQLNKKISSKELMIKGNPTQLQQLILNLFGNAVDAVKASDNPSISFLIEHAHFDQQLQNSHIDAHHHDYVHMMVRDNGYGIEKAHLERIFDPFFTTKEVGKGTGMGLSIVHGILHSHQGHIKVESSPGKGTSCHLFLPIAEAETVLVNDHQANAVKVHDGSGRHILVVDDESSVVGFMQELLKQNGYRVVTETASIKALDTFKKNPERFDLVITDQTMPGLTGAELARKMLEIRPELPIVLNTGYSEDIDEARAKEMGIQGYLHKPIDVNMLMDLMSKLLKAS